MHKVYEEVAGPEVPLKGAEQALRMSVCGKLWYLAGVIGLTEAAETRLDSMMCTMVQSVWRLPGKVAHTTITLPHAMHGLAIPLPSREVRMRRWGVVMAIWRCKHMDMRRRFEGWAEEARSRLKLKRGPDTAVPDGGVRGFMGWLIENDGVWKDMDKSELWVSLLRDAVDIDFHVVKGSVEVVRGGGEEMSIRWVVQLGNTWAENAGKQLHHGTELKERMQEVLISRAETSKRQRGRYGVNMWWERRSWTQS